MLSLAVEFFAFAKKNKKLWLAPVLLILIALGLLLTFGQGSIIAPFIYAMF